MEKCKWTPEVWSLSSLVHRFYFKQGWGLAVVLKPLDQQFKREYYFLEGDRQASEDNYIASEDLAHLSASLVSVCSSACL